MQAENVNTGLDRATSLALSGVLKTLVYDAERLHKKMQGIDMHSVQTKSRAENGGRRTFGSFQTAVDKDIDSIVA